MPVGIRDALLGALVCICAAPALAVDPSLPPVEPVTETVNGVEIRDPYRWMEAGGDDFDRWARAEATHARATLDAIPGRAALQQRIAGLDSPGMAIRGLQVQGGRWLYRRTAGDGGKLSLYTRVGRDGAERPVDLLGQLPATDGPWSEVDAARVLSPDGRYLSFGTTRKGEANPTLRVFDLEHMRLLPDAIPWPLWADANGFRPRWLADSSGFLYVRRPDADEAMGDTERARRGQVLLHRLGEAVARDRSVFGYGLTPQITETDTLYVQGAAHPRWLAILRRMPEGREVWVIDLHTLEEPGLPEARRVYASDVLIRGHGVLGDQLYVIDPAAPRHQLLRFDLTQASPEPEVALPEQEGVLRLMATADDAVYVTEDLLNRTRLHVVDAAGARTVALPEGVVTSLEPGVEGKGAWLSQVDWLTPPRGWLVNPGEGAPAALDFGQMTTEPRIERYVSRLAWATARDGERIPYTLVEAKAARRDGSGFVMMDGYGCFGSANQPFYWPSLQAWLERGGVFVSVALRGGGELGADWHRAGRDRNKPAAFEDAIDVAKDLVRSGVTRPGRIGVTGGSCGGMTMGMAALEAPHLIGAAQLSVGAFDLWRMADKSAAGARSIRDIGDPSTPEGTRRILALSPYMQVLDGAPRPALLIGSGATDYTVPLWVGGKMVARARAATPDGKPVLWNIGWESGHNAGVDYVQLDTDQMAFMFWQLGHPDFQLPPPDPSP
ncbi:prolyl oligopeptidase family serine peptidase [Arenimonas aestuarii]